MKVRKTMLVIIALGCVLLAGCQKSSLPEYNTQIELQLYGKDILQEDEILALDAVCNEYAQCLLTVEKGGINEEALRRLAPGENPDEWKSVYKNNKTVSQLVSFQILDIYVDSISNVKCLCVCEANYQDWKTPEDRYLFILQIEMEKTDLWHVISSQVLGTARKSDVDIIRDDITNAVKFVPKKGGDET